MTGRPDQLKDLFCDPAIAARVADRGSIDGSLREVDESGDRGFFRSLCEVDGCFNQSGLDGVYEVGRIGAFHGFTDRVDLMEVTDYDIGTELFQGRCAVVLYMDHRADIVSAPN